VPPLFDWSVCFLLTLKHLVSLQDRTRPSVQADLEFVPLNTFPRETSSNLFLTLTEIEESSGGWYSDQEIPTGRAETHDCEKEKKAKKELVKGGMDTQTLSVTDQYCRDEVSPEVWGRNTTIFESSIDMTLLPPIHLNVKCWFVDQEGDWWQVSVVRGLWKYVRALKSAFLLFNWISGFLVFIIRGNARAKENIYKWVSV
jgi:hypothetical protein